MASVSELRVGTKLSSSIYDGRADRDILLIAAGTTVTPKLLDRLHNRGVSHVRVEKRELLRMRRDDSAPQGKPAERPEPAGESRRAPSGRGPWQVSSRSFLNKVAPSRPVSYRPETKDKFAESYRESLHQVERLFQGLTAGEMTNVREVTDVSNEALVKMGEDLDLFVSLGLQPAADAYPFKHSLQTAMLAMSLGTVLGLTKDELVELGIGCLIHDAGMLHVKPELVRSQKVLDRIEFLEITKHPTVTFDLLRDIMGTPRGSRMVAYQMHERCDGSGYPRRRQASQIHYLTKIAAVADVFIALISPRPHRRGMLPYHAMEQILHDARKGLYDPNVVRGLLQTVSLFPIGSYVELSDGRVGRVIRSNRSAFSRPVVELWPSGGPSYGGEAVDLAREPELEIVRPLARPGPKEVETDRHGVSLLEVDLWE